MKTWDAENLLVVEYHGSLIKKKWELFWRMIAYLVKVFLITAQSFLTDTKMMKGFIQSQGLINKMNGRQRMQTIFFQVLEIVGAGLHGEDVGKIMM